ncbi:MAG: EAL domain-containing protein [Lachnospiraceae bacterium]|nr:EAL domain-containing protein [Lachnospiraceae bacterium]
MQDRKDYKPILVTLLLIICIESVVMAFSMGGKMLASRESAAQGQNEIAAQFDSALAAGDIEVWYQPIVDAASGTVCGAEALARWRQGDALLLPAEFLPALEEAGKTIALDEYVFQQAAAFQKEQIENGGMLVPVSVNLSDATLQREVQDPAFVGLSDDAQLQEGVIQLEVTENGAVTTEQLADLVNNYHAHRLYVTMDGLGQDSAGLAGLAAVPYDAVKIDQALTANIGTIKGDALVKETASLVQKMGMRVIVEGVETEEQAGMLRTMQCDALQGFHFFEPLSKEDFQFVLSHWK